MTRRIDQSEAALGDIVEVYVYLASRSPEAADRFIDAVRATLDELARQPYLGHSAPQKAPKLRELSRYRVNGFRNYAIIYRVLPNAIDVVRIMHAARDLETLLENE